MYEERHFNNPLCGESFKLNTKLLSLIMDILLIINLFDPALALHRDFGSQGWV